MRSGFIACCLARWVDCEMGSSLEEMLMLLVLNMKKGGLGLLYLRIMKRTLDLSYTQRQ